MKILKKRRTVTRWLTGAVVATAASALITPTFAVAATPSPSLSLAPTAVQAVMSPRVGYDGYLCNIDSLWIRDVPNDGGGQVVQLHTGDPVHVYRTNASDPSIPAGWGLGYGRPGGGAAYDGYFKVGYVCT